MLTYFVHSTSKDNEQGVRAGWNDSPLAKTGLIQASALKELVDVVSFDRVFASDLRRAIDTAQIVFSDKPVLSDPRLREMNYGKLNGASEVAFPDDEFWCIENGFDGGECCRDVEDRVEQVLSDQYRESQEIAVFSHRYPQLALEVILNGATWQDAIINDWRKSGDWQAGWRYDGPRLT